MRGVHLYRRASLTRLLLIANSSRVLACFNGTEQAGTTGEDVLLLLLLDSGSSFEVCGVILLPAAVLLTLAPTRLPVGFCCDLCCLVVILCFSGDPPLGTLALGLFDLVFRVFFVPISGISKGLRQHFSSSRHSFGSES